MGKRPTESGGEPSSSNCGYSAEDQAHHLQPIQASRSFVGNVLRAHRLQLSRARATNRKPRRALHLKANARYNSLVLLGQLLQTMGMFGIPKAVRSDNDAVFKTRLFKTALQCLGVRQQFTDLGSPWQNGRIE
jgi:hypothetical protein